MTRLRLPPGEHDLTVSRDGVRGEEAQTVSVVVTAGGVTVQSVALLGRDRGDRSRLQRARRDITYEVQRPAPARRGEPGALSPA